MSRESNFKFLLSTTTAGGLEIWGIPGNFDLSSELSKEVIQIWVSQRRLLYFSFEDLEAGLKEFFANSFKSFLHWHETPWVFLSTDLSLKDREKILCVPEASKPKEFKFLARVRNILGESRILQSPRLEKEKLLLHVCCGPDAAGVVEQLKEDFDLECFWYDPNIQPREEYDKRLNAFKKVMSHFQIPYVEGPYDVERFEKKIEGLEWTPEQGAKCSMCYDMRLEKSAELALERNIPSYATTLAISPHKVQKKLIQFGELNFKKLGVRYFHEAFMKQNGFNDSVEFTKEHNIYRQDYCGCFYSLYEGGAEAQKKAKDWGYLPNISSPVL